MTENDPCDDARLRMMPIGELLRAAAGRLDDRIDRLLHQHGDPRLPEDVALIRELEERAQNFVATGTLRGRLPVSEPT